MFMQWVGYISCSFTLVNSIYFDNLSSQDSMKWGGFRASKSIKLYNLSSNTHAIAVLCFVISAAPMDLDDEFNHIFQECNCPSSSEVTLKDMGKIN